MNHVSNFISILNLKIKNSKTKIIIPNSKKIIFSLLVVLKRLGFIGNFFLEDSLNRWHLELKYTMFNKPVLRKIQNISKPSRRVYMNIYQLKSYKYKNKTSILILSTTLGLLSIDESIHYGMGGEVIVKIN